MARAAGRRKGPEAERASGIIDSVSVRPVVLLTPSMAAAVELPRRLASTGRAVAGLYAFKVLDLAKAIAEPALLGQGLAPWDSGHDALRAARLLDTGPFFRLPPELPRAPLARALARTLSELRRAGLPPEPLAALAEGDPPTPEDAERLRSLAALYRRYDEATEGRIADPVTILRAAEHRLPDVRWLAGAEVLLIDDLELDAVERGFVAALARVVSVRFLGRERPPSLRPSSFAAWAGEEGIAPAAWSETALAPVAPPPAPEGLSRIAATLFEPPQDPGPADDSVELLTAPGEAAEVQAIVRRLLRAAARGVPFEEMGVVLPRPETYAPLFTDLLERLHIPFRLHPSLPLRFGRAARSLLLLFRCRRLERPAVMELLTFAPIRFAELLPPEAAARPAQWDAISRDAGIVSELPRWIVGLRHYADLERQVAEGDPDLDRRGRRQQRAEDAEALLRLVELIAATLDGLSGEAPWPEWSARLREAFDQWIGPERDREAVADVISDLASLGGIASRAPWREVEDVIEARFEWERLPLEPVSTGAVHVGAMDAMAGLPFRVLAIPGLVEGGFPGVLRPDPFLLDREREALNRPAAPDAATTSTVASSGGAPPVRGSAVPLRSGQKQLSLFDDEPPPRPLAPAAPLPPPERGAVPPGPPLLPTTQDRLREARRMFHRATSQATEQLMLSYPRADPRTGRERLPSLFFVAAASTLAGRPVTAALLETMVHEDEIDALPLPDALDRAERDRMRVRAGGHEAATAIAAGSAFFKQSRLASEARWSTRLTRYDGLVADLPLELARKLDPVTAPRPISASQLATFSRCGFQYLLQYVLRLEPALEPEERKRLEPLERGDLFHKVAERYLRERRERGELPVTDTPERRARLLELAKEALEALVEGSPPRFTFLWNRERARFCDTMLTWLQREAAGAGKAVPAHFEVGFGVPLPAAPGEVHSPDPLEIDIGDGRILRVSGKIDRIDRKEDGSLVLRDYKTGKAPRDDGGIFRGGKQLQIPFYILAAARFFPDQPVVESFLDYVDAARQVAFDPPRARSEEFRKLLRDLTDAIADGLFVQEHTSCDFCDYTTVCGPKGLLERRRPRKTGDQRLQRVLRLRDVV
jgi:RecB family exonuclease